MCADVVQALQLIGVGVMLGLATAGFIVLLRQR